MDYILVKDNIQASITEACSKDIRTVVIPEGTWHLCQPVMLPDGVTVILDNANIIAETCAFCNENASIPYALATEQQDIHILGIGHAQITAMTGSAICLYNVRDFSVSGISVKGGLQLRHARKGRLQRLSLRDYGLRIEEGSRELIIEDITGNTKQELVAWVGGDTSVWGRSNEICQSVAKRICGRTEGAPLVSIRQGNVETENMILWDITDKTNASGVTVLLGEGEAAVRDITLRRVSSCRTHVKIGDSCDGVYVEGSADIAPNATRVLTAEAESPELLPVQEKYEAKKWISANEEAFRGADDGETLQNAIDAAALQKAVLVIPRYNQRTGKTVWQIGRTLRLPVGARLILLDAHLRMEDHTYCNMFFAETGEISIRGIGSATLDSGKPNGLKRKTAGKFGFGPIQDNALIRLRGCVGAKICGLNIKQTRWYGIYSQDSCHIYIRDIDYYAPGIFPDLGGVYIGGGCRNITVENITGILGADGVLVEASRNTGSDPVSIVNINTMIVNVCRSCMVRLFCHDGDAVSDVLIRGLVDSSVPEQKMQPRAMVCIGQWCGWSEKTVGDGELCAIIAEDICGRSTATVELGGSSRNVKIKNIHSFGNTGSAILSAPEPEVKEYILMDTQKKLCAHNRTLLTRLSQTTAEAIFFRCIQASAYMRGTATSVISDKKKFVGTVLDLSGLETDGMRIKNILSQPVGEGVLLTGKANVEITNMQLILCGREEATCGKGCSLVIDGKKQKITEVVKL